MVERQEIARLVDGLDHPDADERRQRIDRLVEIGDEAVPVLTANLGLVDPGVRPALIRVLERIGDDEALLPLMRFVYDNRGEPAESDARGLAMRAVLSLADEEDANRLFEFLLDIRHDDDPTVRGYVVQGFGEIGDARVKPFVKEALEDDDEFVREHAEGAWEALEGADTDVLSSPLDDRELLQKIRRSTGTELEFYMGELLDRDHAFELAEKLVREGADDSMRGLRLLQKIDDDRVRDVARRLLETSKSDAERAVCLRILADRLDGDADERERALIRQALDESDAFVSEAALEAAGVSGDPSLAERVIDALDIEELGASRTAAEALAEGASPELVRLMPRVTDALERIHHHRVGEDDPELAVIEGYLLRTIRRITASDGMARRDARAAALLSLDRASQFQPVLVEALKLLDQSVPESLDPPDRVAGPDVAPLIELFDHPTDAVARRAASIARRLVDPEVDGLSESASNLVYQSADFVREDVVPLLEMVGDDRARELLEDLTEHNDSSVADAADAALRRLRDSASTLDVEYE